MSKHIEIVSCNICGKSFNRNNGQAITTCPECYGDTQKALNRIFTKDTVMLVCKWYNEGDSIKSIAKVLNRSEASVRLALEEGGVKI